MGLLKRLMKTENSPSEKEADNRRSQPSRGSKAGYGRARDAIPGKIFVVRGELSSAMGASTDQEMFAKILEAAESGDVRAMNDVGDCICESIGTVRTPDEAAEWYRKAAEAGYAPAQYSLGCMFEEGRGVKQSYARAMELHLLAAAQGDPSFQYHLGCLFEEGECTPRSMEDAVKWYSEAAKQGHQYAKEALERIGGL